MNDKNSKTKLAQSEVADAPSGNWVDQYAPLVTRPYLRLMRADRPIGIWLLLWPCWWSASIAAAGNNDLFPNLWHLILFAIGATVMRGAGCTYNDIVDKDIDAQVARTKSRPLPSGDVSPFAAKVLLIVLALVGLAVLLQFNYFSIVLGIASLAPVAIYPFMKRFISFPQLFLGLAFSWGALMGWAAIFASLNATPILLYVASISWTIGYDTIYAHQDKEDDAIIGLGSTALAFGENTKTWLTALYALTIILMAAAGWTISAGAIYFFGLVLAALHLTWQVRTLDINDAENCLHRFRSNRDFGGIVFASIIADSIVRNGF